MADTEDDGAWVFDSLVCFLNGPVWNAPLQSFIEEKSLIFEPSVQENEEYRKVFEEFKNLVDFMLGNFMEDMGITPEQFQEACSEGKKYRVSFDHSLFEQIWAANDFEMFVRLMTQRNVELQLQALELIEHKYGIKPQSFIPKKDEDRGGTNNVKSGNKREYKASTSGDENNKNMLENLSSEAEVLTEVAKNFAEEPKPSPRIIENVIMEQKPILEEQLKEAKEQMKASMNNNDSTTKDTKKQNTDKKDTKEPDSDKIRSESEKDVQHTNTVVSGHVDALELKKRQEYLRAQRDKLVALKKDARKKQLDAENSSENKIRNRPKSAKAAEAVLTGAKPDNIEPGVLQIRKTLAERLKSEVVANEGNK